MLGLIRLPHKPCQGEKYTLWRFFTSGCPYIVSEHQAKIQGLRVVILTSPADSEESAGRRKNLSVALSEGEILRFAQNDRSSWVGAADSRRGGEEAVEVYLPLVVPIPRSGRGICFPPGKTNADSSPASRDRNDNNTFRWPGIPPAPPGSGRGRHGCGRCGWRGGCGSRKFRGCGCGGAHRATAGASCGRVGGSSPSGCRR